MIKEEVIIVQQGGHKTNIPTQWNPVYRVRYGKKTSTYKEHSIFGIIKFYTLIKEDTVWDDYFTDYDMVTGERVNHAKISTFH